MMTRMMVAVRRAIGMSLGLCLDWSALASRCLCDPGDLTLDALLAGIPPRRAGNFLLLAQKKVTKEKSLFIWSKRLIKQ